MKKMKEQLGLSLIELTVVLAVSGLIAVPLTSIFRLQLRIPERIASQVTASRQLQKSTLVLIEDAQAAQSFTFGTPPEYGTFAWSELSGADPIPVTARYFFKPGTIVGAEEGIITGLEMISSGVVPDAVRSAISYDDTDSRWTIVPDTGSEVFLDSNNTSANAVTIGNTAYNLVYTPANLQVTIIPLDGSAVGSLLLFTEPGRVLRELLRGGEGAAGIIVVEGIVQFDQVQFQVVDPVWEYDSDNNVWDYTEGKIIVTITQIHQEVGADLGQATTVATLVADFRPQGDRPVDKPSPGGAEGTDGF